MGVHGLWELLSPVGQRVSNEHVRNKVVAVDISIWLTQFVKAMRDAEGAQVRNGHLLGVFRRCIKLLFLAVKPVLIFDGATPALKRRTLAIRRAQREKQAAKLRRLAEKLVVNQLKRTALGTAIANRKKRIDQASGGESRTDGTGTDNEQPSPGGVGDSRDNFSDDEDRIEPNIPQDRNPKPVVPKSSDTPGFATQLEQQKSDEVYAQELDREEIEAAEYDKYNTVHIPEDLEDLDDEALMGLPGNVQSEVFKQIKLRQRAKHREEIILKKTDPSEFSRAQIDCFLKNTALNKRISSVRTMINANSGASRRIASDNQRQFVLEEHPDENGSLNEFEDDSDDDVLAGASRAKGNRSPISQPKASDILSRIRAENDHARSYIQWQEPVTRKEARAQLKSDSGVGWAAKVLEKDGGHVLGGRSTTLMTLEKSHHDSDDDSDVFESPTKRYPVNERLQEDKHDQTHDDNDSDSDVEWEDGDDRNNLNLNSSRVGCREIPGYLSGRDIINSDSPPSAPMKPLEDNESDFGDWEDNSTSGMEQNEFLKNDGSNVTRFQDSKGLTAELKPPEAENIEELDSEQEKGTNRLPTATSCDQTNGYTKHDPPDFDKADSISTCDNNIKNGPLTSDPNNLIIPDFQESPSVPNDEASVAKNDEGHTAPNLKQMPSNITTARGMEREKIVQQWSRDNPLVPKVAQLQKPVDAPKPGSGKCPNRMHPEEADHIKQAISLSLGETANEDPTVYCQGPDKDSKKSEDVRAKGTVEENSSYLSKDGADEGRSLCRDVDMKKDSGAGNSVLPVDTTTKESANSSERQNYGNEATPATVSKPSPQGEQQQPTFETDINAIDGTGSLEEEQPPKTKRVSWQGVPSDLDEQRNEDGGSFSIEQAENLQNELEAEAVDLRKKKATQQGFAESLSEEMYAETRDLIKLFGIPYLEAPTEAEAQCAFLNLSNVVDGIITEDSDAFLFGAKVVYRHLFAEGKFAEAYHSTDIESSLGLEREQLIQLALLLGSDYTSGVRGVGIVNSMEILEAFPGPQGLTEFREWTKKITVLDEEPEESVMNGSSLEAVRRRFCWKHRNVKRNWEVREDFPNPAVFDAYMKPAVNESTEKFKWGKVDFNGLAKFCWEKFGWGVDKFEGAVGALREDLEKRNGPQQRRIEEFFRPHRFAKIKSERLQKAVTGIAGEEAKKLMAPLVPRIPKRKALPVSHIAPELSDEEFDEEIMEAVDELEADAMRKRQKL